MTDEVGTWVVSFRHRGLAWWFWGMTRITCVDIYEAGYILQRLQDWYDRPVVALTHILPDGTQTPIDVEAFMTLDAMSR